MLSAFLSGVGRSASWLLNPLDRDGDSDTDDTETVSGSESINYEPSFADVLVVKAMLSKALDLPNEIVDRIAEHAEYWPHTTTETETTENTSAFGEKWFKIIQAGNSDIENSFLIRSIPLGFPPVSRAKWAKYATNPAPVLPLKEEFPVEYFQNQINSAVPLLQRPCRKIVFTFESRDQGWGNPGPEPGKYSGSWTWFSVGLERFEAIKTTEIEATERTQKAVKTEEVVDEKGYGKNDTDLNDEDPSNDTTSPVDKTEDPPEVAPEEPYSEAQEYEKKVPRLRSLWPEIRTTPPATNDPNDGAEERSDPEHKYTFPLLPLPERKIQANITTSSHVAEHRVVWKFSDDINPDSDRAEAELEQNGRGKGTGDGKFVRDLKLGDVITVWGHSRFPGWVNYIKRVKIDVYYSV